MIRYRFGTYVRYKSLNQLYLLLLAIVEPPVRRRVHCPPWPQPLPQELQVADGRVTANSARAPANHRRAARGEDDVIVDGRDLVEVVRR